MSKTGQKIIEGLKAAVAGDLARVTIDGQTWERTDLQKRPVAWRLRTGDNWRYVGRDDDTDTKTKATDGDVQWLYVRDST